MSCQYRVTGLMSGSSLDGVDMACCEFHKDASDWEFRILAAETLPYPAKIKKNLKDACNWNHDDIQALDIDLGKYYADLLIRFHASHQIIPDLIASHGHTILHEPAKGITLQAGHGGIMAAVTGITVVNDFRSADVAQGGQGAPLVPVGDQLLFSGYDACLNLGGIANISYENLDAQRIAYDLCPANMALNWIAALHGHEFDEGGAMAKQGQIDLRLLQILNNLEFYSSKPPKSLGREWFLSSFLPIIEKETGSVFNLMATVVEHIAIQISLGIDKSGINTVLVTGGGALNQTLMERIKHHESAKIEIPEIDLIQFKEAIIFAFLGLLKIRGEINCLASVTGGKQDLSTGTIYNFTNSINKLTISN